MPSATKYKSLYNQSLVHAEEQDRMMSLLQERLAACAWQIEEMQRVMALQQAELAGKDVHIEQQHLQLVMQERVITDQSEKLSQQQGMLEKQDQVIINQQKQLDQQQKELSRTDEIKHELRMLKRQVMGIKSERHHRPTEDQNGQEIKEVQLSLELMIDAYGMCRMNNRKHIPGYLRISKNITPKKRGGRHDFPEGLEEEIIEVDVPDRPAGARLIRYEEQRQLACDPLRWFIKVTRRPVYLVADAEALEFKQLIAPLPPHPIERCKFDISVLVMLVIDKYRYHLPVWRQRQRFKQYQIDLSYSTLVNLVNRVSDTLEPLWHLLLKEIIISRHVHSDETRYKVLDTSKKKGKKSHLGWIWALMNPVQRICCFLYQPGRGKKDIRSVLQGYQGYLMTDAYVVYMKYGRQPGVKHQQCVSHARRYFDRALENDAARAGYALDQFFAPLYAIEDHCKILQLDYDAITERRQSEAVPILESFRVWLQTELPKTKPRTPIHKAIAYSLAHFDGLLHYTTDGMLEMDNNCLEGQIRALALGRHNHLFAGSHRGGQRDAMIYSFMATCKLQGIDPAKWLDDVLRRIPGQPEDKLIELLPQFWKPVLAKKIQSA